MNDNGSVLNPERQTLWFAYLFAPSIAPVLFAAVVFVSGLTWLRPPADSTDTPMGIVLLPILSLTVGLFASYLVAGVIGMPIAFHLRKRQFLNFYTIHGAAFGWSVFLGIGIGTFAFAFGTPRPPLTTLFMTAGAAIAILSPFILLSATTFWWMIKQNVHSFSLQMILFAAAIFAVTVTLLTYFFRA